MVTWSKVWDTYINNFVKVLESMPEKDFCKLHEFRTTQTDGKSESSFLLSSNESGSEVKIVLNSDGQVADILCGENSVKDGEDISDESVLAVLIQTGAISEKELEREVS